VNKHTPNTNLKAAPVESQLDLAKIVNDSFANCFIRDGKITGILPRFDKSESQDFALDFKNEAGISETWRLARYMKMVSVLAGVDKLGDILKENIDAAAIVVDGNMHRSKSEVWAAFTNISLLDKAGKPILTGLIRGEKCVFGDVKRTKEINELLFQDYYFAVDSELAEEIAVNYFEKLFLDESEPSFNLVVDQKLLSLLHDSGEHNIESLYSIVRNGGWDACLPKLEQEDAPAPR
jgi:hypothetical protein